MKLLVFGLTISSSWGNGHATLWRGLCKGLAHLGHEVIFFERDVPYYANARDGYRLPRGEWILYECWNDVARRVREELHDCDAAMVTSYCPDAAQACAAMCSQAGGVRVFYDLDAPITLAKLQAGEPVAYVPTTGLGDFDLVLSYAGGAALREFTRRLGARRVAALYGHVDPDVHRPVPPRAAYRADLSWLGTYAADRQATLERLFVVPARRRPERWFLIGGAQYPETFPWTQNIAFVQHVPPHDHAAFFASSRLTLNVTRAAMAQLGWCPSGRMFEAAACGATVLCDEWPGLTEFYAPGTEVLVGGDSSDTLRALECSDAELRCIGQRARERTLDEHTCHHRARTLVRLLEQAAQPVAVRTPAQDSHISP